MITTEKNAIADAIVKTKRMISFCKVVIPTLLFDESLAILPNTVLSPVRMQIPTPDRDIQNVPCMPIFFVYCELQLMSEYLQKIVICAIDGASDSIGFAR